MYAYLRARNRFASKVAFFNFIERNDTVDGSVNGKILADKRTGSGNLGATGLSYEDFAGVDRLAAKSLNTEALSGVVVDVLA